jgi:hypothetical protein
VGIFSRPFLASSGIIRGASFEAGSDGGEAMDLRVGDFIFLEGTGVGVVVAVDDDRRVPAGYVAIWFGGVGSQVDDDPGRPEVWTVPAEHCREADAPVFMH